MGGSVVFLQADAVELTEESVECVVCGDDSLVFE